MGCSKSFSCEMLDLGVSLGSPRTAHASWVLRMEDPHCGMAWMDWCCEPGVNAGCARMLVRCDDGSDWLP